MKRFATFFLLCVPLLASEGMREGMKSIVERSAVDGIAVCKRTLIGKNHVAARSFLGASDLNHGEEEYTYHPARRDGSMWILLIEFDGDRVSDVLGEEIMPAQKKEPNQSLQPTRTYGPRG